MKVPGGAGNTPGAATPRPSQEVSSLQKKFIPNPVRIDGDAAYLSLTNRDGDTVGEAIIDLSDLGRVLAAGRWYASWNKLAGAYYVRSSRPVGGSMTFLHRFVTNAPKGADVDHRDHNTLDCRKGNLRVCSHAENMRNRHGAQRNSKSGIRGVYWERSRQLWRVQVKAKGRKHEIGRFADLNDAAKAAAEARARLHGEFAT